MAWMTLRSGEGPRLRLTEHAEAAPGWYRVEVALEGDGPRKTATSAFESRRGAHSSSRASITRAEALPSRGRLLLVSCSGGMASDPTPEPPGPAASVPADADALAAIVARAGVRPEVAGTLAAWLEKQLLADQHARRQGDELGRRLLAARGSRGLPCRGLLLEGPSLPLTHTCLR
jgi:hypothetical protein